MSMNGTPIVGEVVPAPGLIIPQSNGQRFAFQQVVTAEMSMGLLELITAKVKEAVLEGIRAEFDLFPKTAPSEATGKIVTP